MMTLQNFENRIDPTILKRGKEYYKGRNIEFLEETEKGFWQADVVGSDSYVVEIKIKNHSEIEIYSCDCPYDHGDCCKHIVAVLYAIQNNKTSNITTGKTVTKSKKMSFANLLESISLKEYQGFIAYYSTLKKDFKTEFELYFAEKDETLDIEKKYTDLIKKTIRKNTNRGFIDYQSSKKLAKEMDSLIDTVQTYLKKNNVRDALAVTKSIIKEVTKTVEYCDDSNGSIGEIIEDAIELLSEIANTNVPFSFKEQIADFLETELKNSLYFDYGDFGYHLIETYSDLAIAMDKTDDFLKFVDLKINETKNSSYNQSFFLKLKINVLKATGKTEAEEELIQQNLDIVDVRTIEVNKAIDKKEYDIAKKLIADGIKIAEGKSHPGTVLQWERELLRIAVLEEDIPTIRNYSKSLAFDNHFNISYYKQWKSTFDKAEWTEIIENFIQEKIKKITKNHNQSKGRMWLDPHPPVLYSLAPIYIQEHYFDRLLALVKKETKLDVILQYHSHLCEKYPEELLEMYIPALELYGDIANDRSHYNDLTRKMKIIIKDIPQGKEKIISIAKKLKEKYPRRPAMIDELNKILVKNIS